MPYFILAIWHGSHTILPAVKMTMHIDEDVLARVMKVTGAKTKTLAVEIALKEMARRHKMKELFTAGLGLTPEELRNVFAPESETMDHRGLSAAEDKTPYGKPGSA